MWSLIFFIGVSSAFSAIDPPQNPTHQRGIYGIFIEEKTLKFIASTPVTSESDKTIDVSSLGIKKIENHVFDDLTNVTSLDLSNNEIETIPALIFVKLKNLQTLSLADNKLRFFDRSFIGLRNLKSLDLSNNLIESFVTGDLFGLPKTVNLTTYGNPLEKFLIDPDNSSTPYYLPSASDPTPWTERKVYVESATSDPSSDVLPWHNHSINGDYLKLCMSDNGFVKSLSVARKSEALGDCRNVTKGVDSMDLYLTNLTIREFHPMWYRIRKDLFTDVIISFDEIIDISPNIFVNLPDSITAVYLQVNRIKRIGKNSIQNRFLKKISFAFNEIEEIEDEAFAETNLVSILLARNKLGDNLNFVKTLPVSMEELDLSSNSIHKIPEDLITNLIALRKINLSRNHISNLSVNTFRGLKKLQMINVAANDLTAIEPGTFEDQGELRQLDLSFNKITKITPEIFRGLKSLSLLSLKHNEITKITKNTFSVFRHSIMEWLDLSSNEIETIEKGSFSYMTIRILNILFNRLTRESVEKGAFELCTIDTFVLYFFWYKEIDLVVRDGALLYRSPYRDFEDVIYTDKWSVR